MRTLLIICVTPLSWMHMMDKFSVRPKLEVHTGAPHRYTQVLCTAMRHAVISSTQHSIQHLSPLSPHFLPLSLYETCMGASFLVQTNVPKRLWVAVTLTLWMALAHPAVTPVFTWEAHGEGGVEKVPHNLIKLLNTSRWSWRGYETASMHRARRGEECGDEVACFICLLIYNPWIIELLLSALDCIQICTWLAWP